MDRPFVVCHMLSSLDGKIDGEFFADPKCRSAIAEYGKLRGFYNCQASIVPCVGRIKHWICGVLAAGKWFFDR